MFRNFENQPPEEEYEILKTPELRANYVSLTDELVRVMVQDEIDVVIYLDKSARPLSWMVDELWDQLAPPADSEGKPYKKPQRKFLNIDREQWGAVLGRSEEREGRIDIRKLPPERAEELREVFAPVQDNNPEHESLFTNKKILVIDEVMASGDTLEMATGLLDAAFPDAKSIKGIHWMSGTKATSSGARTNTDLPVWYSDREVTGRLVGDRDTFKSEHSNSKRQRIGKFWLSTAFRNQIDQKGLRLKEEMKILSRDLAEHKIPYMPSPLWEDEIESIDDRIERLDGISVDSYMTLIKATNGDRRSFARLYSEFMHDSQAA